jgi:DNA repair exonuclease SbcCD ATPase subunit
MSYHIPSDEQVKKALKKIFSKRRTINSQITLKNLVEKELKTKDKNYGVSNNRLRNIAINSDFIKLEIHSREGDPHKIMNKCPVCGHSFKNVKNLTIWGGEVTIEFRCDNCGYWTGKKNAFQRVMFFRLKKIKKN